MQIRHWMMPAVLLLAASCSPDKDRPDGSGTVECTQVRIAPEVGGRLATVLFKEGDAVTNGQVLATLDTRSFQFRVDEARAALAQARAQADLAQAGSRKEDILRAQAQTHEADVTANNAATEAKRIEALFAQGSATLKQRDDATAAAERAAATLWAAQHQLDRLSNGNRPEEIRAALAAVDLAQARLAQAVKALADCAILAPLSGTITTKEAEPGEVVMPGTALATVTDLDDAWLSLYLPEPRLAAVTIGQKVRVRMDGSPQPRQGTISFIAPEAEFTPRNVQTPDERAKLVYRIKVTLPNSDRAFKPGMPADGYL